jgi:quercetin dioxygenase-like cupin family protein
MGKGDTRRIIGPEVGAKNLTLNYTVFGPGHEFPQHIHDISEDIFIVLEGGVSVRQGENYTPIWAGDVVFVPSGEVHGTVNTTNDRAILISFQGPPDLALYAGKRDPSVTGEVPKPPQGHKSQVKILKLENGEPVDTEEGKYRRVVFQGRESNHLSLDYILLQSEESFSHSGDSGRETIFVLLEGKAVVPWNGEEKGIEAGDGVFLSPGEACEVLNRDKNKARLVHCRA